MSSYTVVVPTSLLKCPRELKTNIELKGGHTRLHGLVLSHALSVRVVLSFSGFFQYIMN